MFPLTPWKFKIGGDKFKENYYKFIEVRKRENFSDQVQYRYIHVLDCFLRFITKGTSTVQYCRTIRQNPVLYSTGTSRCNQSPGY